jgi:hypothetical protein
VTTASWVSVHLLNVAFQAWIIWGGGAHWLNGTVLAHPSPPQWGAEAVKLFAWLALLGGVFWLVLGLVDPASRFISPVGS